MTAPAAPPQRGWDAFLTAVVPISGLVAALATIIITYQISRISDLSGDIKNVNSRVDQIYPLIYQSTADIGNIKGSLEATAQKIANAAEKNENLTKRLDSLVTSQENQVKNIRELTTSVSGLATSIKIQQQQLEDIKSKINFNPTMFRNRLLQDSTVFSPRELSNWLTEGGSAANMKIISIDWNDQKASLAFFKSLPESRIDFGKIFLTTKDPGVAETLEQTLAKAGFQIQK